MKANAEQMAMEALDRAQNGKPCVNDVIAISAFEELGFEDVRPRENVLTFWAWKAKNRSVKKGEHGVKVVTWIPMRKVDEKTGEESVSFRPKTATLFHESQTVVL